MNLEIKNLKEHPEYLPILAKWHHAEWGYLYQGGTLGARVMKLREHLDKAFVPTTFIGLQDELVGSASIVKQDMGDNIKLGPWLASVYVHPSHRKKGIGTKLVHYIKDQAIINNIGTLFLFTFDKEMYYQSLGWNVHQRVEYAGSEGTIMKMDS